MRSSVTILVTSTLRGLSPFIFLPKCQISIEFKGWHFNLSWCKPVYINTLYLETKVTVTINKMYTFIRSRNIADSGKIVLYSNVFLASLQNTYYFSYVLKWAVNIFYLMVRSWWHCKAHFRICKRNLFSERIVQMIWSSEEQNKLLFPDVLNFYLIYSTWSLLVANFDITEKLHVKRFNQVTYVLGLFFLYIWNSTCLRSHTIRSQTIFDLIIFYFSIKLSRLKFHKIWYQLMFIAWPLYEKLYSRILIG